MVESWDRRATGLEVVSGLTSYAEIAARLDAALADPQVSGILLDLDSPESVDNAADQVIALTNNRLFGLFNNAGYGVYGPLESISRAQMVQQFSGDATVLDRDQFGCAKQFNRAL